MMLYSLWILLRCWFLITKTISEGKTNALEILVIVIFYSFGNCLDKTYDVRQLFVNIS